MQKTVPYRVSVSPLAARRLHILAIIHGKTETQLVDDLISRQYQHDSEQGNILVALDELNHKGNEP